MKVKITKKIPNPVTLPIVTKNGGWKDLYDMTAKELRDHPFVEVVEEADIEFIEKHDCINCSMFNGQYMHCCIDNKSYRECNFGFDCIKYSERNKKEDDSES